MVIFSVMTQSKLFLSVRGLQQPTGATDGRLLISPDRPAEIKTTKTERGSLLKSIRTATTTTSPRSRTFAAAFIIRWTVLGERGHKRGHCSKQNPVLTEAFQTFTGG